MRWQVQRYRTSSVWLTWHIIQHCRRIVPKETIAFIIHKVERSWCGEKSVPGALHAIKKSIIVQQCLIGGCHHEMFKLYIWDHLQKSLYIWDEGVSLFITDCSRILIRFSKLFCWVELWMQCKYVGNSFNLPRTDSLRNLWDFRFIPFNLWYWDEKWWVSNSNHLKYLMNQDPT